MTDRTLWHPTPDTLPETVTGGQAHGHREACAMWGFRQAFLSRTLLGATPSAWG